MRIDPIEHDLVLSAPTEGYVRTSGLHLSDIYNDLYKSLNPARYDKRDKDGQPLPFSSLHAEIGTAFEEVLEPAIRARIVGAERPGEYVSQHTTECASAGTFVTPGDPVCHCGAGVIFTPDHFLFNGLFRVGELKLTWMSCRYPLTDKRFAKWLTQIRAYCYHLQTRYARLYVLFINGDYSSYSPLLKAWDIEFTDKELLEEWRMLLHHARRKGMVPVA